MRPAPKTLVEILSPHETHTWRQTVLSVVCNFTDSQQYKSGTSDSGRDLEPS